MTKLNFNTKDEWLAARRGFITGTDAAKLLGMSDYGDALSVYLDKMGLAEPKRTTRKMTAGLRYQHAILEDYAIEKGHEIEHVPDYQLCTIDKGHVAASLDALDLTDGAIPVDAKNVGYMDPKRGWGRAGTAEIPNDYRCQLATQMAVKGKKLSRLAVLVGGVDLVIFEQAHNAELEGAIMEAAAKFWRDHIVPQKPPKPTVNEDGKDFINKLFPVSKPYAVEGTDEDEVWLRYLKSAMEDYKDAEHRKDEAQLWLKQRLGDAEMFCGKTGDIITWKNTRGQEIVDWEKVAAKLVVRFGLEKVPEDLLREATREQPGSRRFVPKWAKRG